MYEKEGKGMGDNSDQNQKKRQNRDFIIPDLRNETDRQYQYSKRPYQREYLSGTEWDREEKDTTRKSGGNTNKKSRQNKVGKKKLNPTHAKAAKRNKNHPLSGYFHVWRITAYGKKQNRDSCDYCI